MSYCSSASARFGWLSGLLGDRGVNTEESRMARTEKCGPPITFARAKERVSRPSILVPLGVRSEREKIHQLGEGGLEHAIRRLVCIEGPDPFGIASRQFAIARGDAHEKLVVLPFEPVGGG
jgi:hypothetical protein